MDARTKTTLAHLLGSLDAVFVPCRSYHGDEAQRFHQARLAAVGGWIPWRGGGSEVDRQASARLLQQLAKAKHVSVRRSKGLKVPMVRLSDDVEHWARQAVGLPDLVDGWVSLERVAELCTQADRDAVPEHILAGWPKLRGVESGSADAKELVLAEEMAMAALVRNWLTSAATVHGHVLYAATRLGLRTLHGVPPTWPAKKVKYDRGLADTYREAFEAERLRIGSTPAADDRDIAPVPVATMALTWPVQDDGPAEHCHPSK